MLLSALLNPQASLQELLGLGQKLQTLRNTVGAWLDDDAHPLEVCMC